MKKLIELAMVLAAVVFTGGVAGHQGDNFGKGDLKRAAQGAGTGATILGIYSVFRKRQGGD